MKLDYGKPDVAMPVAIQWVLGGALGVVVVAVVGIALTVSQGPVGGYCAGPAAALSLGLWSGRLRRGPYYRHLSAAIWASSVLGLIAVVAFIKSRNWG